MALKLKNFVLLFVGATTFKPWEFYLQSKGPRLFQKLMTLTLTFNVKLAFKLAKYLFQI